LDLKDFVGVDVGWGLFREVLHFGAVVRIRMILTGRRGSGLA